MLLAVIACSVLFGARLIMTSSLGSLKNPLALNRNLASEESLRSGKQEEVSLNLARTDGPHQNTSTAWQLGSLIGLLAIGLTASVGLLKAHRRNVVIESAELGGPISGPAGPERFATKRQDVYRVLNRNLKQLLTSNINVGHIVSKSPLTVAREETVQELAALMKDNQIRHLLICDSDQKLLGVVSDRDVSTAQGATAGDIMTPHPCTVSTNTDLRTAITIMLRHRFSSLPVLDGERLVGIITVTDLIIVLQVALQLLDKFNAKIVDGTLLEEDGVAESNA